MTIILRDITNKGKGKGEITRLESCKYCTDYKGDPKPIMPENMKHARKMEDGSYMCGVCQVERLLKLNTPNSDRAKETIAEREIKQEKELQFKRREAEIRKMPGERLIVNPATKSIEERT